MNRGGSVGGYFFQAQCPVTGDKIDGRIVDIPVAYEAVVYAVRHAGRWSVRHSFERYEDAAAALQYVEFRLNQLALRGERVTGSKVCDYFEECASPLGGWYAIADAAKASQPDEPSPSA